MTKIIIHPGQAHFDELLAAGLVLVHLSKNRPLLRRVPILRREPTPEELADKDVWVLDVGMKLEPELHNFDHHQDRSLPAAFRLVADALGVDLTLLPWAEFKSDIDTKGPFATAKVMGVKDLMPFLSPVEQIITDMLAGKETVEPGDPLYALIKELGSMVIN